MNKNECQQKTKVKCLSWLAHTCSLSTRFSTNYADSFYASMVPIVAVKFDVLLTILGKIISLQEMTMPLSSSVAIYFINIKSMQNELECNVAVIPLSI